MRSLLRMMSMIIFDDQVVSLVTTRHWQARWAGGCSVLVRVVGGEGKLAAMMIVLNSVYSERNRNAARIISARLADCFLWCWVGLIALVTVVNCADRPVVHPMGRCSVISWQRSSMEPSHLVLLAGVGRALSIWTEPSRRADRLVYMGVPSFVVFSWASVSIAISYSRGELREFKCRSYGSRVSSMLVWAVDSSFSGVMGLGGTHR